MRRYRIFDVGHSDQYFDTTKNKEIIEKVANKCYLPTNRIIKHLLLEYPEFKVTYSLSGVFVDQLKESGKVGDAVLQSFRELVDIGKSGRKRRVELLNETYHHSLAFLFDEEEFIEQIKMHKKLIKKEFNFNAKVFRNTELIYNNHLAEIVSRLGYRAVLTEGTEKILGWRSPTFLYKAKGSDVVLLLKHYKLSDDIAFRFSQRTWPEWPLTADKFAMWINAINGNGYVVNLFMDYETFGEHQWKETGIFDFLEHLPSKILRNKDGFVTPTEAIRRYPISDELDVPFTISWADTERDLSAWLGNEMQYSAIQTIYKIKDKILNTANQEIIEKWRRLQTSDHFYYMCTKWFNDGDVHKYFNPYHTPYEAYINMMNILNDLIARAENVILSKRLDKSKIGVTAKRPKTKSRNL